MINCRIQQYNIPVKVVYFKIKCCLFFWYMYASLFVCCIIIQSKKETIPSKMQIYPVINSISASQNCMLTCPHKLLPNDIAIGNYILISLLYYMA